MVVEVSEAVIKLAGESEASVGIYVELLPSEAAILGEYFRWLRKRDYQQRMHCLTCWEERTTKKPDPIEISFAEGGELGLVCRHRMTMFHGRVPLSAISHGADDARPSGLIIAHLGDAIPTVKLASWEVELLLAYKGFLKTHRYVEGLHCGKCFQSGNDDGVAAVVTEQGIDIRCRCRHLVSRGLTG